MVVHLELVCGLFMVGVARLLSTQAGPLAAVGRSLALLRLQVSGCEGEQAVPLLQVAGANMRRVELLGVAAREPADGAIPNPFTLVPAWKKTRKIVTK